MEQRTRGEAREHVEASPPRCYELVSDVTRMGEWSPETVRCEWVDGATGPAVGARFKGSNKRGWVRWSTTPRVVSADPGREFAFVTSFRGTDQTRWTYRFEPSGDGTDIVESFELLAPTPRIVTWAERNIMRIKDRAADLEASMGETLRRIKVAAEREAG